MSRVCVKIPVREINNRRCIDGVYLSVLGKRGVNELEGTGAGVCISEKPGTGKVNVGKGYLEKDRGLVGDAHAGTERQVSVLTLEVMEKVASEGDFLLLRVILRRILT